MKRITLIRTAPDVPPGSMPAYAHLVEKALDGMDDVDMRTCDFFDSQGGGSMRKHHLWRLRHARRFFLENPSDLYHLLDGSMAGFLPSTVWKKTIVTVHDLIPLLQLNGQLSGRPSPLGRVLIQRGLRMLAQSAGVISVSEHTKRDLLAYTGSTDIQVVHHPVRLLPEPNAEQKLPERFLFHIGNNADYKNRRGVLDVFERLQDIPDLYLVMAGPEPTMQMRQHMESLPRVSCRVDVSDAELSALYQKASVFLFPSLYEGFGMPVLEAMQTGCPVVCSTAASLPEVVGDAALMASASDLDGLARHCRTLCEDPAQRDRLIRRGREHLAAFSEQRFSEGIKTRYAKTFSRLSSGRKEGV